MESSNISNDLFYFLVITLILFISLPAKADVSIDITGTYTATPKCTINNDNEITVKFGDMLTTRIGPDYAQPVTYSVECPGLTSGLIKMQLAGGASSFDGGLLETTNADLAVKFLAGGTQLPVNTDLNFDYQAGPPVLTAIPVQRPGATLNGGDFSATATMKINVQ
ncbi:fimbrial protein [Rahnella laticis]|uniref:fimbrial protein n=1 Tax=Rahnella laticis TaxID=2787622 RepID=UPI0018A250B8|nr:fimbrial protein [Rahnella laticis]MBF7993684.1 fimbrial protein [Rahnella laticis]